MKLLEMFLEKIKPNKVLKTENVGFLQNAHARMIIERYLSDGWGIDQFAIDSQRETWITFYRYQ